MATYRKILKDKDGNNIIPAGIIDMIYPVGSIYMSATLSTVSQVQNVLGGTWEKWGAGRVPVGVDTSQTEFSTVGKTGGEKKHRLTKSELPNVSGYWEIHGMEGGTIFYNPRGDVSYGPRINGQFKTCNQGSGAYSYQNPGFDFGNDESHNNLQPYITCYMYKRTA